MESSLEHVKAELRSAASELSSRGLRVGATWALELLSGAASSCVESIAPRPLTFVQGLCTAADDADAYALAKAYFDGREFARAAHALDRAHVPHGAVVTPQSFPARAFFLRCYALYLVSARWLARGVGGGEEGLGPPVAAFGHGSCVPSHSPLHPHRTASVGARSSVARAGATLTLRVLRRAATRTSLRCTLS